MARNFPLQAGGGSVSERGMGQFQSGAITPLPGRSRSSGVFYVALTRARGTLILSSFTEMSRALAFQMGAEVTGRGRTIASRFLAELGAAAPPPVRGDQLIV